MSGRILIIDTVATNRIVLKVKMQAAQYAVDTCATRADAAATIARARPDLILINLSDPTEDRHAFCRDIKSDPETADISIIGLGIADTCRARFAALDAGADEVMPRPTDDTLLLARIRSLLRMRNANAELWLRDGTSRALGFEEGAAAFVHAARIAVLTADAAQKSQLLTKMHAAFHRGLQVISIDKVLADTALDPVPDLFIIDGSKYADQGQALFRLVADLRSRAGSRLATQLVVVPRGMTDIAAMALDLGADDIVFDHVTAAEIAHRAKILLRRKTQQDKLRATVRNGLHAAVTDPLTGLYNRRYAVPHLVRLSRQARKMGQDFTVMMLDIDHFKEVNDRHGHAAGDTILRQISERFRQNLRAVDMIARIGGEEFLIAMPNTEAVQAEAAADRLRRVINGTPFILNDGKLRLRITLSIGVAVGGTHGETDPSGDVMCLHADQALYAAKLAGRDRVSFALTAA